MTTLTRKEMMSAAGFACAFLAFPSRAFSQQAQPAAPPIKRLPLQTFDVPGTAFETVIGIAEIGPNVLIGRHFHPGPESGFIMSGTLELLIDGQPPRLLKTGDSYVVSTRIIHDARSGPEGTKVIATYVVEKGQPLASPAP